MSTQLGVRVIRIGLAIVAVIASGWFISARIGLYTMIQTEAEGWHIFQIPEHRTLLGVAYVAGALGLPMVAAWLVMPPRQGRIAGAYLSRLAIAAAGAVFVALTLFLIALWNI